MGKQKTFEFTDQLRSAQRALAAARQERQAFLASLPRWDGDLAAVKQGLGEEQMAQSARLAEAERQAAHTVWADPFWASLTGEDQVSARQQLSHIDDASA
ncbi:hypothetical protein [Kitasatospora brasiliensis]|uniref:hypothetical protein n=1 Tax=Kitasatospora brasiliensis TaxID=3058040 RepID=UPI00292DDCD3|nr:hypothetical protein [Kitasatospora sp. K002]